MTVPQFRSTASFTLRQRNSAPTIDRATFVVFSLGGHRFSAPVEAVERVLRQTPSRVTPEITTAIAPDDVVQHAGRQVRVVDLRAPLGVDAAVPGATGQRTIVFTVQGVWVAAVVDAVFEVATIDAATVRSLPSEPHAPWATSDVVPAWPAGARGLFRRHDHDVLVLDMTRVLRSVFASTSQA